MKVLVVDDEFVSKEKMRKIMSSIADCEAVESGSAALAAYKSSLEDAEPFDLIMLDISMPVMDGTETLHRVRRMEEKFGIPKGRQAAIVMVTSQTDKKTVLNCIKAGCDDYVVKPFDRAVILEKLEKLNLYQSEGIEENGAIREIVMDTIRKFRQGDIELPVLPKIIQEIQELFAKPTITIEELTRAVEKDAVISAKLVGTANSPLYRGTKKIQDINTAMARIGLKESQCIITAIANKSIFMTGHKQLVRLMEKLWSHSLACAYCARGIAQTVASSAAEKIFFMGLIHDIGCTFLLKQLSDNYDEFPEKGEFNETELMESMQEVHANFGAALLEKWGFTQDFVRVTKCHEWKKFGPETEKELLIVSLADTLAQTIGYGFFSTEQIDPSELQSSKLLKLTSETLDGIGEDVVAVLRSSGGALQ